MTTAAPGRAIGLSGRRPPRVVLVVGALVAILGGWLAVHLTMPSWYARMWYPLDYAGAIRGEAAATGLDADLIAAVIYRESKFSTSARSDQGAVGLMQVLPATASWIHRQPGAPSVLPDRLAEPGANIAYGAWYLRYLTRKYGGVELALVAYNGGETNLRDWMASARREGTPFTLAQVPFAETRGFVTSVEHARGVYRRAWGAKLGRSR